jgi:tRNA(His) 5'-end guanylyltransferase
MPVIIRLDGRCFHTYTKGCTKPVDERIVHALNGAAKALISEISGAKIAYIQSDEISILVNNFVKLDTSAWYDNVIQKIVSVSASIATAHFNASIAESGMRRTSSNRLAYFDSRVFVLPKEEVNNYFVWRQRDAIRNSISAHAQVKFSNSELHKKSSADKIQMLDSVGVYWSVIPDYVKHGWCVTNESTDFLIPLFSEKKNYIETHLLQANE